MLAYWGSHIKQFLGVIENETEALLLIWAHGYYWGSDKSSAAYRRVDDGFEFVLLKLARWTPPYQINRVRMKVTHGARIHEVDSEVWGFRNSGCTQAADTVRGLQVRSWSGCPPV